MSLLIIIICALALLLVISASAADAPGHPSADPSVCVADDADPALDNADPETDDAHRPLRVRLVSTTKRQADRQIDVLSVQMCGSVYTPTEPHDTEALLELRDITEDPNNPLPIFSRTAGASPADRSFRDTIHIGKLPCGWSLISNWTAVSTIATNSLHLPRTGTRTLELQLSVLSCQTGQTLAQASSNYCHTSTADGYLDLAETGPRVTNLTTRLAHTVAAHRRKPLPAELDTIEAWRQEQTNSHSNTPLPARCIAWLNYLAESVRRIIRPTPPALICQQLTDIAPPTQSAEALKLCLQVAAADDWADAADLALLRSLARWLDVDPDTFGLLLEKHLPVTMHQVHDPALLLGLTGDMDSETLRRRLSHQYHKWNNRVNHRENTIRRQATLMLQLIATVRTCCADPPTG